MSNFRRIQIFGAPCAGKSALSFKLCGNLKAAGASIELVQEQIKLMAYQGITPVSFDIIYLFSQHLKLEDTFLRSGVEFTITDSPLLLQCIYCQYYETPFTQELTSLAAQVEQQYPSLNIFLDRKNISYQKHGRYHSEEEANLIDGMIKNALDKNNIKFYTFDATYLKPILNFIKDKMGINCEN